MQSPLVWVWLFLLLIVLSGSPAATSVASPALAMPETSPVHVHPGPRPIEKIRYSEFNHHAAGAAVLLLGLLAMGTEVGITRRPHRQALRWLWPAGWVLFGTFLFIRSDPDNWPWGSIGLLETLRDPETRQHKVAAVVVLAIGIIEGLRTNGCLCSRGWALVFPLLGIASGLLLGLHSQIHVLTPRVYLHHIAGAVLGVLIGTSKLLSDRGVLPGPWGPLLWPILLSLFGVQFLFYTEQ
ncbi:hypothetical protein [Nitrospira sp. Kam-Ns4a]